MSTPTLTMDINDLARELKTSVRTIKYRLSAGEFPIPQVHGIDKKHRWARSKVEEFVARGGVVQTGSASGRRRRSRASR